MNREQAAKEVKSRYAEYLKPAKKKNTYICPLCKNGSGKDGDGMSIDPHGDGTQLHCFVCGFHGDIIDLYQQEHKCDVGTAFAALYDRFGIKIDNDRAERVTEATAARNGAQGTNITPTAEKPVKRATVTKYKPNYSAYYEICAERINDPAAQAYLSFRGISNETAARYNLGFDPAADPASAPGAIGNVYKPHPCPRLIIPFDDSHYMGRSILASTEKQYLKLNSKKQDDNDKVPPFNLAALYNDDGRPVFITEGAIDALSVIEAGGEAVGLNSTSNVNKLLAQIGKQRTRSTLILCLDKDDPGQKAAATLADGLRGLNIPFVTADICGSHKDPNEALTANYATFYAAVAAAQRKTNKPDNTADYVRLYMADEIAALKKQADRRTGFKNLDDEAGSIYAGLYVIGGISSVGKTTFISQLADQMAALGQHILFFSMEQSRLEMVSKSIARQTAVIDPQLAVSSLQIRTGASADSKNRKGEIIENAVKTYLQTVGERMSIIEGNFNCDVSFIGRYTRKYIALNEGVKPIVIVDYLQVLQPDRDPITGRKMTDTRQIIDHNVTELKRLSRSLEIPVFVVSSINRNNYLTPIDYEAFKESGGIEYTADVVWGLQLTAIHDKTFDSDKVKEKREKIAAAKEAIPRDIELVCLKNRYGKSRYAVQFTYYPQYDYFAPVMKPANNGAWSAAARK